MLPGTEALCRYHIGESLLPSARQYLAMIGAEEIIENYGFTSKVIVKPTNGFVHVLTSRTPS